MTAKTKKPVTKKAEVEPTEDAKTIAKLSAKIEDLERIDAARRAEEQEVRIAERQTIEAIREESNNLIVEANPTWPAMYKIKLEKGGNIPPDLRGNYTSVLVAEKAIAAHLG